jgi:hypothetical protein
MTDDDEIAERAHQEPPRGRRAGKTLLWALTAAVLIILVIAFRISTHKHAPAEQGAIRLSSAPTQGGVAAAAKA